MTDEKWTRPDLPSRCTYSVGTPIAQSPHSHNPYKTRPRIASDVLELVGSTPVVRLNRIPQSDGVECEFLAKCEFLNPGGSVKDRIARRMVEEAEKSGRLKPGDTLIEPTSGNTGIGLALAAATKGYRCIIVMPEKMSMEKEYLLRGLGAEIVRTPTAACFDDRDSHLRVAEALREKIGSSAHILNQYVNPYNPIEHYDQTAEEIVHDCTEPDGKVKLSMVVAGAGTGGTITGLSRKLKEKVPNCKIVAVDPEGSILAHACISTGKPYEVEGIGYDFVPTVLDRDLPDKWVKTADFESLTMARRLLKEEGLLCGGSSGAAMVAAIKAAKECNLGKDDRVVVLLPDSIRNYMTKYLSDNWMYNRGFMHFPNGEEYRKHWINKTTEAMLRKFDEAPEVDANSLIRDTVKRMNAGGSNQAIVVEETDGKSAILGLIDSPKILQALLCGHAELSDTIHKVTDRSVRILPLSVKTEELGRRLMTEKCVIVLSEKSKWIVTQDDFLQWTICSCC